MDKRKRRIYQKRRKRHNYKKWVILLVGITVLSAATLCLTDKRGSADEFSMSYVNAEEIPQFLQFAYYDKAEWEERLGGEFTGRLTYQKLETLLELLNIEEYVTYEDQKPKKQVKRDVWNEVYEQITELIDLSGKVEKQKLLVLKNQGEQLATQEGTFSYAGEGLKIYECYEAYVTEDKLLGIAKKLEEELPVENVYVRSMSDTLNFLFEHETYEIPLDAEGEIKDTVCDVWFEGGEITRIEKKEDVIEGKLLTLDEEQVEIEGYGKIDRSVKLPVYQIYDECVQKDLSDLVIGNMNISYIVADKRVSAVLLKEPPEIKSVRILLLNENQGIMREEICVTSQGDYKVACGKKERPVSAGTVTKASEYLKDAPKKSLKLEPSQEGGTLYICGEDGTAVSLPYTGSLEIRKYDEGYAVVSVLPLEQYLYAVVPSEMPSNYPQEALKAQAVCARSYASIQMMKGAYAKYGAHMDDSVNYQVYNKQERDENTTKAVDDTRGLVLSKDGEVLEAYYYSTSFGHSGSYESWNLENNGEYDYLTGTWLKDEELKMDLSDESVFSEYIKNPDENCYDSFAKFFRWSAKLDVTGLSEVIKEKINARKSAQPGNIRIAVSAGKKRKKDDDAGSTASLGELTSVAVGQRNSCGGVKQLTLTFEGGKVEILDEYSMRIALGPAVKQIVWHDGSEGSEISTLPSSYFTMETEEEGKYALYGGGYGHGIGMSQNGAKGMAEKGYSYEEILGKFYAKTKLLDVYANQK